MWNAKVNQRNQKCPPPLPILSQLDPVHSPTSHFLKTHLNIIPHLRLGFYSGAFLLSFPIKSFFMLNNFIIRYQFIQCWHFIYCHIFCLFLSESQNNFQYTDPIMHTPYIYSHIHQFPVHRPYNAHSLLLQPHTPVSRTQTL